MNAELKSLVKELRVVIERQVKHDRKLTELIKTKMLEFGVTRGETQRILSGVVDLSSLEAEKICTLTQEIYKLTGESKINPYLFFTDKQIKNVHLRQEETINDTTAPTFPIVFNSIIQEKENDYIGLVNIRDIARLYNDNLLEYNYDIRKQYKYVTNKGGRRVKTIDINMNQVRDILDSIRNNTYKMDKIVLNVLMEDSYNAGQLEYNKKERKLIINKEAQIDIIDGLHDIVAFTHFVEENQDTNLKVETEIKHYNLEEIKAYYSLLKLKNGGVR